MLGALIVKDRLVRRTLVLEIGRVDGRFLTCDTPAGVKPSDEQRSPSTFSNRRAAPHRKDLRDVSLSTSS